MKKTTELKVRIAITWAISMIAYFIGSVAYTWAIIHFDLGLRWMILVPLMGFVIAMPIILRQENIREHLEKVLKRKENKNG